MGRIGPRTIVRSSVVALSLGVSSLSNSLGFKCATERSEKGTKVLERGEGGGGHRYTVLCFCEEKIAFSLGSVGNLLCYVGLSLPSEYEERRIDRAFGRRAKGGRAEEKREGKERERKSFLQKKKKKKDVRTLDEARRRRKGDEGW